MRGSSLVKSRSVTSRSSTIASTARRAATLSFLAVVMTRSTQRRSSLPLASVVSMRPWSSSDVTRLRLIALRCAVDRPNFRPAFWCRTLSSDQDLGQLVRRKEAALYQLFFDLIERLATEVAQAQQVFFAERHQLAHFRDFVCFETVQGTHGKIQVLDWHVRQPRRQIVALLGRHVRVFDALRKSREQAEMRRELLGGLADRLVRLDGPVRPDLEDQLVPVRLLANAGLLDQKIRLDDRAEDRIDRNHTDWLAFFLIALRRHIAFAALDGQLHAEPALVRVQRADIQIRIDDLDVTRRLDVRGLDLLRPADVQRQPHGVFRERDQVEPLEVENDLRDVFLHVRNRRE